MTSTPWNGNNSYCCVDRGKLKCPPFGGGGGGGRGMDVFWNDTLEFTHIAVNFKL